MKPIEEESLDLKSLIHAAGGPEGPHFIGLSTSPECMLTKVTFTNTMLCLSLRRAVSKQKCILACDRHQWEKYSNSLLQQKSYYNDLNRLHYS